MKDSTNAISDSCPIREVFTALGLTAYGGASLLVDFLRRHLNLRDCFRRLPLQKASWATYRLDQELDSLVGAYALGIPRIGRMDEIVHVCFAGNSAWRNCHRKALSIARWNDLTRRNE